MRRRPGPCEYHAHDSHDADEPDESHKPDEPDEAYELDHPPELNEHYEPRDPDEFCDPDDNGGTGQHTVTRRQPDGAVTTIDSCPIFQAVMNVPMLTFVLA